MSANAPVPQLPGSRNFIQRCEKIDNNSEVFAANGSVIERNVLKILISTAD